MDRLKLKNKLIDDCLNAGVQFHLGRAKDCVHDDDGSKLACLDDLVISASFVIDATGHARKLTKMDGDHDPGYQAAYGIMAGALELVMLHAGEIRTPDTQFHTSWP